MIVITGKRVTSDCGLKIRRKGTNDKPVSALTTCSLTADDFEEVPADERWLDRGRYVQLTEQYVDERYSPGEESALCRKMIGVLLKPQTLTADAADDQHRQQLMEEFAEYDAYVEQCKLRAMEAATESEFAQQN